MKKYLREKRGQAILEYVLITTVVLAALLTAVNKLKKSEYFFKNITAPIVSYLQYNYKYADASALGWDESGGPRKHIQISKPNASQTFRMFRPER